VSDVITKFGLNSKLCKGASVNWFVGTWLTGHAEQYAASWQDCVVRHSHHQIPMSVCAHHTWVVDALKI